MTGSPTYTEALQTLGDKIDALGSLAGHQQEILAAVQQINGHVRVHGETLAANQQWVESHERTHVTLDARMRTLGSRLWMLSGGSGVLAGIAILLQTLGS